MKNIRIAFFTIATIALSILSGCTKEVTISSMNVLQLETESYSGESKAYINNNFACWEDGDQIKLINVGTSNSGVFSATVNISYPAGRPSATASADGFSTNAGDVIYAGYPLSSFHGDINPYNQSISINLPKIYYYSASNSKQNITAPMAGKLDITSYDEGQENPNILKFKNLCTLLKIQLISPTEGAFTVDTILVVNKTTGGSPLCGDATVSFASETPSLSMNSSSFVSGSTDRVMLVFRDGDEVAINSTKDFYIPIAPIASDQSLRVYIHNSITGNWFWKAIHTNSSIPGNCIASLPGPGTDDEDAIYTFYNFLQNTNSDCLVNLDITPDNTFKMEMVFKITADPSSSQYFSGSSVPSQYSVFTIGGSRNDTYLSSYFLGSSVTSQGTNSSNTITRNNSDKYRVTTQVVETTTNHYKLTTKFETINNSNNTIKVLTKESAVYEYGIHASNPILTNGIPSIYVFGYNSERHNPGMKLYSYRVWRGEELLYNFVPAKRRTDNAIGLWDMVGKRFVQGTGSFSIGND